MSLDTARRVLKTEAEAILDLVDTLDENFVHAVDLIVECTGKVAVIGILHFHSVTK